jgi:hypothetical protein
MTGANIPTIHPALSMAVMGILAVMIVRERRRRPVDGRAFAAALAKMPK